MTVHRPNSTERPASASAVIAVQGRRSTSQTSARGDFRNVLKTQQATGKNVHKKEDRSTQLERSSLAAQGPAGRTAGVGFAVNSPRTKGSSSLDAAATSTLLRLNALTSSRAGALLALSSRGLQEERPLAPLSRMAAVRTAAFSPKAVRTSDDLGSLSANFESGDAGVAAIGYDRQGGTSYGQYQISSRAGTMGEFLEFLEERAPEWARGLRAAGPANTGGRGGAMPREWKRIAAEHPDRFTDLQRRFVERTHYLPALKEIRDRTGIDIGDQPKALQEVLWSTAVQHGARGAAKLFCRAIDQSGSSEDVSARRVIDDLYAARGGQFGGSSAEVRASVMRRFQEERKLALGMLGEQSPRGRATV